MSTSRPFRSFPKTRRPLPPEFAAIYSEHYKTNRDGCSTASSLSRRMESWMHRKVAEDLRPGGPKSTLEVGAGTLNHLPYEQQAAPYDIVEPFRFLYESSINVQRVRKVYSDVNEIPKITRYDRIISIATFEHICNLPEVIARSALLLTDGGQLRVAIPSEGTLLWALGWHLTTALEFRLKHNLDYGVVMRHEHVNTSREIEDVLRYCFRQVACSVFGITQSFSFYQFYACSKPNLERCSRILETNGS